MIEERALRSLTALLPPGRVFTDRTTLITYEVDAGLDKGLPDAVVFPRTSEEVMQIARWASEYAVPLVARGSGTGLSGGAVADRGGVIVEFVYMREVTSFLPSGRSATVQPALINLRLDERVRLSHLYFPPDPSSQRASTLGGNVAENSGGPHCFKYGVTTNYVTGLEVVLADGLCVHLGGPALDYPEYDLCGLVTGSEGMLALVTSITVRMLREPPAVKTLLAIFHSVEEAGTAVSAVIAAGLVPATLEMMDTRIVQIVEPFAHAQLPLDAGAVLIVEFDGYPESLDSQVAEVRQILLAHNGYDLRIAKDEDERARIWQARKSAAGAIAREAPAQYTVDITVPRSQLAAALHEVNEICDRYGLRVGHVFHAGDGNLHPLVMIDKPGDAELLARVHAAGHDMVQCCVALGGTLTGEHGVGIEKRQYMLMMHSAAELLALWDIKQCFDPANLLNPGKVFPAPEASDTEVPYAGYKSVAQLFSGQPTSVDTKSDLAPHSATEAAQQLRTLSALHQSVTITGQTLVQQQVRTMSSANLNGVVHYAPDDLYITVGAGTPLREIQTFLEQQGKMLPFASPWPDATIGGLVAANINAPTRMRYGAIRDNVLCATVALADGRVIRTGRPLVKNVAGFDLTKIFIGSHGTLGMLCDLSLKVLPRPRACRTLVLFPDNAELAMDCGRALLPVALNASALLQVHGRTFATLPERPYYLFYTVEGMQEDVESELQEAQTLLKSRHLLDNAAVEPMLTETITGTQAWTRLLGAEDDDLQAQSVIVRVGVPVTELSAYCTEQADLLAQSVHSVDFANGYLYLIRPLTGEAGEADTMRDWLQRLRVPALRRQGYAVVVALPEELRGKLDLQGYQPEGLDLMQRLRVRWDPQHILRSDDWY